jgi:hypothetical protein
MTTATPNEAMAVMRDMMDKALASPNGVRITLLDSAYGGKDNAKREAKRWQTRCYTARSSMRKIQAAAERTADTSILAGAGSSIAPDAFRTAYDAIYVGIDRTDADDGWWLTLRKADASSLGLEVL